MKVATYSLMESDPMQGILIEDMNDLRKYESFLQNRTLDTMKRLIKSPDHPDRWNHMLSTRHHGDSVVAHAIERCQADGGNPVLMAPHLARQKIDAIETCLERGLSPIIINRSGGWCPITSPREGEILAVEGYVEEGGTTYHIGESTRIINFENDPELEPRTREYFKQMGDKDPSWIVNLRDFSQSDIEAVLSQFSNHGGEHVYVYTTGLDVEQMKDYANAIINSPINKVVFEFNAEMTASHKAIIQSLIHHRVNVDVIGYYEESVGSLH